MSALLIAGLAVAPYVYVAVAGLLRRLHPKHPLPLMRGGYHADGCDCEYHKLRRKNRWVTILCISWPIALPIYGLIRTYTACATPGPLLKPQPRDTTVVSTSTAVTRSGYGST